jgi:hypothetical protein
MNFKSKLQKIQRPDWTKNQFRDFNKLWLDKNENSDKLLAKETKIFLIVLAKPQFLVIQIYLYFIINLQKKLMYTVGIIT